MHFRKPSHPFRSGSRECGDPTLCKCALGRCQVFWIAFACGGERSQRRAHGVRPTQRSLQFFPVPPLGFRVLFSVIHRIVLKADRDKPARNCCLSICCLVNLTEGSPACIGVSCCDGVQDVIDVSFHRQSHGNESKPSAASNSASNAFCASSVRSAFRTMASGEGIGRTSAQSRRLPARTRATHLTSAVHDEHHCVNIQYTLSSVFCLR